MSRTKPIIGLFGGIGAGKSRVAAEFAALGCLVVDSDELNHEMLRRAAVLAELRRWWGDGVVTPDGGPDRRRIGEIVFADPAQRERLERLLYPLIAAAREHMIRDGENDPAVKAIVLDSPLLLENNLDRLCDRIVFVDTSEKLRLQRLQDSRNWDQRHLRRREQWQWPLARKLARADFVIHNDGTLHELRPQVADIFRRIVPD